MTTETLLDRLDAERSRVAQASADGLEAKRRRADALRAMLDHGMTFPQIAVLTGIREPAIRKMLGYRPSRHRLRLNAQTIRNLNHTGAHGNGRTQ